MQATTREDFRPGAEEPYELCVYAGDAVVLHALTRDGGGCSGGSCWTEGASEFRYRDLTNAPGGLRRIRMRAGADGKPRVLVRAWGRGLAMPSMPVHGPLSVQLRNEATGQC